MDNKILLQDMASSLSAKFKLKQKESEAFLKTFFEIVSEYVHKEKIVKVKGLGTFKLIEVSDRESVKINTGERYVIPGHSKVTFTPDAELKAKVNKPFELFQTVILNEDTNIEDMERIYYPTDNGEQDVAESVDIHRLEPEDWDGEDSYAEADDMPDENMPIQDSDEDANVLPTSVGENLHEETLTPTNAEASPALDEETSDEETSEEENSDDETIGQYTETPGKVEAMATPDTEEGNVILSESSEDSASTDTAYKGDSQPDEEYAAIDGRPVKKRSDTTFPTADDARAICHSCPWRRYLTLHSILSATITILLVIGSYVAGYYRVLNFESTPIPALQETEKKPVATKRTDVVEKPAAVCEQDTTSVPAEPRDSTEAVAKVQDEDIALLAKGYEQVPEGKYLIVGTLKTRVMSRGDNLYKFAKQELGDKNLVNYIIVHNKFQNPDKIPLGYDVKIPVLREKK